MLKMRFAAGTREHFHANGVAGGDLGRQQIVHALTDRRSRVAQTLDPSGSVDENHEPRWVRISSRSPIQPEPRSFRASSSLSGSAGGVRNAKLMASRFVANWYRRITVAHASSSISTFVRAIHDRYTTGLQVNKPLAVGHRPPHHSVQVRHGRLHLPGAFGAVAEDDVAVQVVARDQRGPLEGDVGGEGAGIVERLGGADDVVPDPPLGRVAGLVVELRGDLALGELVDQFEHRLRGRLPAHIEVVVELAPVRIGQDVPRDRQPSAACKTLKAP